MPNSEIAQLQQRIAAEYMAAQLGLSGLSLGASRHAFITARMERMGGLQNELHALVGEQAIQLVAETLQELPERITRSGLLDFIRRELGATQETETLIAWIEDLWRTRDELIQRFGLAQARIIIEAAPSRAATAEGKSS